MIPPGFWRSRCLECFFRELGVRVVTTGEQLASLGQNRLEQIHGLAEAPDRLRSYLHAMPKPPRTGR